MVSYDAPRQYQILTGEIFDIILRSASHDLQT